MATVTLKGNPVELAGSSLNVGDDAPEFSLQATDLQEVTLGSSAGKTRPSLKNHQNRICPPKPKSDNSEFNDMRRTLPATIKSNKGLSLHRL